MKHDSLIAKIVRSIFAIYYLAIAITIFVLLNNKEFLENHVYLGLLVLGGSLPHLLIYFITGGYKSTSKTCLLVVGIIGFALGFVFVYSETMTLEEICLYWGILDIVRGAIEIGDTIPHVAHNKLELLEIGISIGDIVLGILLCIHLHHGIKLHLIYFGIAFILYAVKMIIEYAIEKARAKNE